MDIFEIVLSHVVSIFFIFSFGCNLWIINFLYTEVISRYDELFLPFMREIIFKYFFGNIFKWTKTFSEMESGEFLQ